MSQGAYSEPHLLFELFYQSTPSCLKVMGGGWGWVAHVILVSAQVPIGPFDFGTAFGLGLGLGWTGIGIGTRA